MPEASKSKREKQFGLMTEVSIKSLVLRLSLPTVASLFLTSVYSIADAYFVSFVGNGNEERLAASGAVGIIFSLMTAIQAVGFTLGTGAGSIVSRSLGTKESEKADRIASSAFFLSLFIGAVISLVGTVFLSPLARLLGAKDSLVLEYTLSYAEYILYSAPLMTSVFVLDNLLRAEGKTARAMFGVIGGGAVNIALDPLLAIYFGLGIKGISLATFLGQLFSFMVLFLSYARGRTAVFLSYSSMPKKIGEYKDYKEIFLTGMPSLLRQGLASLSTVFLNHFASSFGDEMLSAFSLSAKAFLPFFCIAVGIGQGYQPIVGYNYSSGKYERVKEALFFTLILDTVIMSVISVPLFIFAPQIVNLAVRGAPSSLMIAVRIFRNGVVSLPFIPLSVVGIMTFQAIGKKRSAAFLAALRQGIVFLPLIFLLNNFFADKGLEFVQALSDIIAFFITLPFLIFFIKEIDRSKS